MYPCILFALGREAQPFYRHFRVRRRLAAPCPAWLCGTSLQRVLVLETGVGPEHCSRALHWLTESYFPGQDLLQPLFLLAAGFAGALQEECKVGDVIVATDVVDLRGRRWPRDPEAGDAEREGAAWWHGRVLSTTHMVGDPREGYAGKFYEFLNTVRSGEEFLARVLPTSDKSGAAMRATPLGVLPTIGEVVEKCRVQAAVTHNTPDGINAALAAALMTHYFLHNFGPKEQLPVFLQGQVEGQWISPWFGKVEGKGWMSVRAAITAVVRNARLSDLLKDCVEFTGDVDTVATIALAAASCSSEYEQDLPASLVQGLENGAYGRDYLTALDHRLFEHFGLCP